ncbi:MAG: fucose 4-O-acetylase-like acetyltransferase [Candidatus Paceibacteria bacterium]|jgi:fucose 4-O-acetylase-like acetyltransferase
MENIHIKKILDALYPFFATFVGLTVGYALATSGVVLKGLAAALNTYAGFDRIIETTTWILLGLVIANLVYQFLAHLNAKSTWITLSLMLGVGLSLGYFSIDTFGEIMKHSGILTL